MRYNSQSPYFFSHVIASLSLCAYLHYCHPIISRQKDGEREGNQVIQAATVQP